MLFSKSCHFVLFFAYLLSANAEDMDTASRVELGTAGDYAILTKSGISTVPTSAITGDIAVSPIAGTAITGFSLTLDSVGRYSKSAQVTGKAYAASYIAPTPTHLTGAVSDMEAAYNDAAARDDETGKVNVGDAGEIGGLTLTPGVYTFGSDVTMDSDVTLQGTVNEYDEGIFIIQMTGDLVAANGIKVNLTQGALAKNIFWQVAGQVNVGIGAHMEGILLAKTKVTFDTDSSLNGRILAQTACTLKSATIVSDTSSSRRNLRH